MAAAGPAGPNPAAAPGSVLPRNVGKFYLDPRLDAIDFTWYGTTVAALANGSSVPSQINIDAGTDFYWVASTIKADVAHGGQTITTLVVPLLNVVITDTGSQRQLSNQPIDVNSLASVQPGNPYRLILPRRFQANTIVQFQWTNYDAAQTYNFQFVMHGFRLPPGAPFNL